MEIAKNTPNGATLKDVRDFLDECDRVGIPENAFFRINVRRIEFRTDGVYPGKLMADEDILKDE